MKALTLTQPWASLVAIGAKKIETRSWKTNYRGPIAIHAAASFSSVGGVYAAESIWWVNGIHDVVRRACGYESVRDCPRGVVLATADLIDVDTTWEVGQEIDDLELLYGNYGPGRFAWTLENVKAFDVPIPAKGALGLWEWDEAAVPV